MESLNEENSIGDICNMIKKKVKKKYITEFQKRERKTMIIERLRIFQNIMNSKHCRKQAHNPPQNIHLDIQNDTRMPFLT